MKQVFIIQDHMSKSHSNNYILWALIRDEMGTRQNTLVVHLGVAVLLALRWPLLDQLHGV